MADDQDILEAKQAYQEYLKGFQQPQSQAQPQDDSILPSWGEMAQAPINMVKGLAGLPSNVWSGLNQTADMLYGEDAQGNPVDDQAILKGKIEATRDMTAGATMIPGAVTDAKYLSGDNFDPRASFRQELAQAPTNALLLGTQAIPSRVSPVAEAAFTAPETQTALGFADRNNLLNRSVDKINASKSLTPAEVDIMSGIQRTANDPYSMGQQLGIPLSSANTLPAAAANDLARQSPAIQNTNVFQGTQLAPLEGKFIGQSLAPKTTDQVLLDAQNGQQQLMAARKTVVNDLTQASADLMIPGINFTDDILSKVGDLQALIAKRGKLDGTDPIAAQMQAQIDSMQKSFSRVAMENPADPSMKSGFKAGTVSLGDAHDILENVNQLRKSFQEFDRRSESSQINGQQSSPFDNGAAITALQDLHTALGDSIAQKAGEIVTKAKQAPPFMFPWSNAMQFYAPDSIRKMNDSYGALATLQSALEDQRMQTVRAQTVPGPATLIGKLGDAQLDAANPIPITSPRAGLMGMANQLAGNVVRKLGPTPLTPEAEAFLANEGRRTTPILNINDLMSIQRNPLPVLSRDFLEINGNSGKLLDLGQRAVAIGLLQNPNQILSLPQSTQQQVHQLVLQNQVGPVGPAPYGIPSFADGKINSPQDLDAHKKRILDAGLPASDRARTMGALFDGGRFEPLELNQSIAEAPLAVKPDLNLSQLNQALTFDSAPMDFTYNKESSSLVDELMKKTQIHDQDVVH